MVRQITDKCRATGTKFEDPDFGPSERDELGVKSLYGSKGPDPTYPKPETIRWARPQYDNEEEKIFDNKKKDDEIASNEGDQEEEEEEEDFYAPAVHDDGLDDDEKVMTYSLSYNCTCRRVYLYIKCMNFIISYM